MFLYTPFEEEKNSWNLTKTSYLPTGFDNTFASTVDGFGSPIPRTGSPDMHDRSGSPLPTRSTSPTRMEQLVADIDPETVRIALKDFSMQLKDTEKERVSNN